MDTSFISRDSFIAWLKTKPADEQYDYCDNRNCPWAQFLKANGIEDPMVYPDTWHREGDKSAGENVPLWFRGIGLAQRYDNFGGLLARIELYQ